MTRRDATIETEHADAETAATVAAAVRPDNTADVATTVAGATVRTEITRETTGGLQSSVDDYVVNCSVATAVIDAADATRGAATTDDSTRQDSTQTTRTETRTTADSDTADDNTTHE